VEAAYAVAARRIGALAPAPPGGAALDAALRSAACGYADLAAAARASDRARYASAAARVGAAEPRVSAAEAVLARGEGVVEREGRHGFPSYVRTGLSATPARPFADRRRKP
jgi:hypothetical protein